MCRVLTKTAFAAAITLGFALTVPGQGPTKPVETKLFADLARDESEITMCDKERRAEQLRVFGRVRLPISGHCYDGCPAMLPKPWYPEEARRFMISGEVRVDTVVDEKGDVVFAKISKGNKLFWRPALAAAYKSKYQPKVSCNNRPVKFRWTIRYHFRP